MTQLLVLSTRNGTTVAVPAVKDTAALLKTEVTARTKSVPKCVSPVVSVLKASHVTTVPDSVFPKRNVSLHQCVQRTKN